MYKIFSFVIILAVAICSCTVKTTESTETQKSKIKVGIFDTNGDSPGCIADAFEAIRIDKDMEPEVISAATIMSDDILNYDLILFPGGSGKAETNRLGEKGMARVQDLVNKYGKGVIGICAGSYILSQTPGYPSLDLSGQMAIDIEHDHRGHGLVKFSLTKEGKDLFPELNDREINFSKYYEGPVLTDPETPKYNSTSLSTMLSDVHTIEGTPANMTNNRPFITATEVGKGKVVTFVGHPENTPGMRWMIPRMARWTLNKELVSYGKQVVRPEIYTEEILMTKDMLKKQSKYYDMVWGSEEEKIEAINKLVEISAWSAKKKIVGLIRDESPKVRLAAAKAIVNLERTDFLNDVKVAAETETDTKLKIELEKLSKHLESMIGCNVQ